MAPADHLPSPIHDSFPDASATKATSRGQPAAPENKKGESDIAAVRTSAQTAEARRGHRRHFIGGSDARIIMGVMKLPYYGCGEKSAARSNRRTCPAISSSNSDW